MELKIISAGKFSKNCPYEKIFYNYMKRISNKITLEEIKVKDFVKENYFFEKKISISYNDPFTKVIILDKCGKNVSSENFSKNISQKILNGYKKIIFFIGGPDGFDESFIKQFEMISFGDQTWPHMFVRIMLIEQIYRAFCIINNHPYHK
tara:strand:- start:587 stop:1036 length:450 start_codon:yes stop_codon:yes gene_type:complete